VRAVYDFELLDYQRAITYCTSSPQYSSSALGGIRNLQGQKYQIVFLEIGFDIKLGADSGARNPGTRSVLKLGE
jgi:hypothetical protein